MTRLSENGGAFESLGLPALASTADLRRLAERARIQRAMATSGEPDETAEICERLLSDPIYRMREAAAWYFAFASTEDAANSDVDDLSLHDETLLLWQAIQADIPHGRFDAAAFEEAIATTCELLDDGASWQPLEELAREIGDARLKSDAAAEAVASAAQRWICDALFLIAGMGYAPRVRGAAEAVVADDFADDVLSAVRTTILARAADHLQTAASAVEARLEPLLERIKTDRSAAASLATIAEGLISTTRPWLALVEVFDDDPDSGEEGRALDGVAVILRAVAVALVNEADDFVRARQLLDAGCEIAQSSSMKSSLSDELGLVAYLGARLRATEGLQSRNTASATAAVGEMRQFAASPEHQAEVVQAEALLASLRLALAGRGVPRGSAARSNSGVWKAIAGLVVVGVIIAVGAANRSSDSTSSSNSSGGGSAPSRSAPVSSGGGVVPRSPGSSTGGGASSGAGAIEKAAIDRQRSDLDSRDTQLQSASDQIDSLKSRLQSVQSQYPNGAPQYVIDQYESDRQRYNRLVADYNTQIAVYRSDLAAFNARVAEYNRRYASP
jgi:hypothetical protein